MVRPSPQLEGLAAAQDILFSHSTDKNFVDILSAPTVHPVTSSPFRINASKSYLYPSHGISSPSAQPLADSSSKAVLKKSIKSEVNDRNLSMTVGNSSPRGRTLKNTLSSPSVSMRVSTSQPPLPITSLAFSSPLTLSTASNTQPLVHSMASQAMSSSSATVTSTQSSSPTTSSARMPNLHPSPKSSPLTGPQPICIPAEAGPVSAEFSKHAHKLGNFMRGAIEEILGDLSRMGNPEAALKLLRLEMEKIKWEHQQQITELKHNHELMVMELRHTSEKSKIRCVKEIRKRCEAEKMHAVEETKRKQWCANCGKEAVFYCCWNTSYCALLCQQAHWSRHMATCAQSRNAMDGNGECDPLLNRNIDRTSGHKGSSSVSAAPPHFHHQHHPGGSDLHEFLPEEAYYDEDPNSLSMPRRGAAGGKYRIKRRRCGLCKGCLMKNNCGHCAPCRNPKSHEVCRLRRCRSLQPN